MVDIQLLRGRLCDCVRPSVIEDIMKVEASSAFRFSQVQEAVINDTGRRTSTIRYR